MLHAVHIYLFVWVPIDLDGLDPLFSIFVIFSLEEVF